MQFKRNTEEKNQLFPPQRYSQKEEGLCSRLRFPHCYTSLDYISSVVLFPKSAWNYLWWDFTDVELFHGLLNCYYCWLVCLQAPERAEVRLSIDNVMTGVLPYCWKQSWGRKVFSKRMREGMACSRRLSRSISESEEGLSEKKHGAVVLSCAWDKWVPDECLY